MKRYEEFNEYFKENKTPEEHALEMIISDAVEFVERYAASKSLKINAVSTDDIAAGINYYERYKKYLEWLNEEL